MITIVPRRYTSDFRIVPHVLRERVRYSMALRGISILPKQNQLTKCSL